MSEQIYLPFAGPEHARRRRVGIGYVAEDTGLELVEKPRVRGPILNRPELVAQFLAGDLEWRPSQEKFYVLPLDRKNRSLGKYLLSVGTLTSTVAHPREVFRVCIAAAAAAVIVAHSHPSGDPAPSAADVQLTRQLRDAAKAVDIELIDHVICGSADYDPRGTGWYSFRQAGVL